MKRHNIFTPRKADETIHAARVKKYRETLAESQGKLPKPNQMIPINGLWFVVKHVNLVNGQVLIEFDKEFTKLMQDDENAKLDEMGLLSHAATDNPSTSPPEGNLSASESLPLPPQDYQHH
jgi:hypothetical protein